MNATEAEDVVAEILGTVWRRIDDVPADHVLPWCYGVARHILANHRRGESRRLRLLQRMEAEPHPTFIPDPSDSDADGELFEAMRSLKEADREVLRLWAWEQLEAREIGTALGISANAATLRLGRAKRRLASSLIGQDQPRPGHKPVEGTQEPV